MDKEIRKRDELIKEQKHLIQLFDSWVALVKVNDLEGAKNIKELATIVRKNIRTLEIEVEKLTRKSVIITKLN